SVTQICCLPVLHVPAMSFVFYSVLPPFFFFFLLIIPQPHRSTLFPYTTLFRSCCNCDDTCMPCTPNDMENSSFFCAMLFCTALRDRKSTRLNSSHQIISYAVFCLKKKKQKIKQHDT